MRRYLVIAHQTAISEALDSQVDTCRDGGECSFHLVVPVTHPHGAWSDGSVHAVAEARLTEALAHFRDRGVEMTGAVGDVSPVRAAGDALLEADYDEVILSTLPPGPSRWLRQDAVHRLQRSIDIPVTHVVAAAVPA